jgi:hypothetical protein
LFDPGGVVLVIGAFTSVSSTLAQISSTFVSVDQHTTFLDDYFSFLSIDELVKKVENPEAVYNFNLEDDKEEHFHAVTITGITPLHNAVMTKLDIRAGAAIVLAALIADGPSTIYGIERLDRGYEQFEKRLEKLGAKIERIKHD